MITPKMLKWFLIGLLCLIIIAILASCSTAKELIDKAEKKDPAAVAEYARDKYPCKDLLKPDTATLYKDTTIYVDCPDTGKIETGFETIRFDTVKLPGQLKTIRVPVTIRTAGQVITRWYEDSAKLKIASVNSTKQQAAIDKLQIERNKYKDKSDHRGKENWIWRIIASVLICWQAFKIYKRLTTIKVT